MDKNVFTLFRELRENVNRLMCDLLKNARSPQSEALDLNSSQIQVILTLKKFGSMKMSDLTKHSNVVKSSMTNIIDSLEDLNLVDRIRNEKDRRIIYVSLNEKGSQLALSLRHSIFVPFEKKVNCLSPKDKKDLYDSLSTLNQIILKMEKNNE